MSFDELSGIEDIKYLRQFNIGINDIMKTFIVPQGWIAIERVLGHVLAIVMTIAPKKTLGQLTKPFLSKLILDDYKGLRNIINEQSKNFAYNFVDLPYNINKYINHFYRGRGEIQIQNLEQSIEYLASSQRQIIWSLFAIFFGSLSLIGYLKNIDLLFINGFILGTFSMLGTIRGYFASNRKKNRSPHN